MRDEGPLNGLGLRAWGLACTLLATTLHAHSQPIFSGVNRTVAVYATVTDAAGRTPLWNAVNVGITALLHQQGRRVVLVFTDGMDAPMNFSSHNSSLKNVMKRAEEENVMVYAIGLAGGSGYGRGYGGGGGFRGGRGGQTDKPDDGLPKIAAATGGGYFELSSTDNLVSTFTRIADELHHQYALAFTPAKLDGKMHALAVRVATNGLTARARKSYLATTPRL